MTPETQQSSEPPSSRKDFLNDAVVFGYDGSNTLYVMFHNKIMNLLNRCYYFKQAFIDILLVIAKDWFHLKSTLLVAVTLASPRFSIGSGVGGGKL